jgi:gas vesicle protein
MSDRDSSNSVMWFLAGLGFGALLGVLYAPRSGRETREALRNTADEGREFLKHRSREAREAMGDWVDQGREVVREKKDQISSAIDAGRQVFREATKTPKS